MMRRLFIIRKDLHLSAGKLAAMVGHCCEAYWTNFLKAGAIKDLEIEWLPTETPTDKDYWKRYKMNWIRDLAEAAHKEGKKWFSVPAENPEKKYLLQQKIDKDIWDKYVKGIFTKTICECRNLNQLNKIETRISDLKAKGVVLKEGIDYGYIRDKCLTELKVENKEDGTTTVGVWFRPLPDEIAHFLSDKYKLYRD